MKHTCERCEIVFDHEPVHDQGELFWLGEDDARTWCTQTCYELDGEDSYMRRVNLT